jgi:signal transduction histidine kinase
MLSHELRNPLNVLQFTTEALERNGGDPEARARLTSILRRNVDHATSIVRALAGLTLGRAALDGPAQQQVDVSRLAREVVRQLQEMATERDVSCSSHLTSQLSSWIPASSSSF